MQVKGPNGEREESEEEKERKEREERAKMQQKKQEDLFTRMERQSQAEKAAKELEEATKRYKDGSKVGEFKPNGKTATSHAASSLGLMEAHNMTVVDGWIYAWKGKYMWTNDELLRDV